MRNRRTPAIILSLFVVVATVATWLVYNTLRRDVPGPTNTYTATFTDVSGLNVGDDVRVAGVRVGRVDRIDLVGTHAAVGFRVERGQRVYDDTIATVTYQNIIGQRYLGLFPGRAPRHNILGDRAQIPLQRTKPSFDISNLLNGFEPLFTLMSPQQVDNLTGGIIQALQGDSGSVLTLITQSSALAETLAGPDAVLGDVINNLNQVTTILARQNAHLQASITQSRDIMVTLANRRDELLASAGSINHAMGRLAEITAAINPALQQLIQREPGFLAHATGDGRQRFSAFATNLILVWKGLARATQSGAYVDGLICDINSTIFAFLSRVIPALVKLGSPGNIIEHSPICSK